MNNKKKRYFHSKFSSLSASENINQRFFQNQLMVLKYCGLWNPYRALNCSQFNKNSSRFYAVFSIGILTIFFYFFLLTEFLYLVSPNKQKVRSVRVSTIRQSNVNGSQILIEITKISGRIGCVLP